MTTSLQALLESLRVVRAPPVLILLFLFNFCFFFMSGLRKRALELELEQTHFSTMYSWGREIKGLLRFDLSGGSRMSFRNGCCTRFCPKHKDGLSVTIKSTAGETCIFKLSPKQPQRVLEFTACSLQDTRIESQDCHLEILIDCGCDVCLSGEYTGHLIIS